MWIAYFQDGDSIPETRCDWNRLAEKEKITALSIVHHPLDLLLALDQHLKDLLNILNEQQRSTGVSAKDFLAQYIHDRDHLRQKNNRLVETLQLVNIYDLWMTDFRKATVEYEEWMKIKEDLKENGLPDDYQVNVECRRVEEARNRIDGSLSIIRGIRDDAAYWKDQSERRITLTGSDKHRYFFWQDKERENKARILGGKITRTWIEEKNQRIGMVVTPQGNCVCAEMSLLTGWSKVYYTTVHSLRLNLADLHTHIRLEEIT